MSLLATWDQYSTYVDSNGKYRVIWQFADGQIMFHKFDTFHTEAELDSWFANYELEQIYAEYEKLNTQPDWNEALIVEVITQIRTHPALTLAQYNTFLAGKQWYEAAFIRAFIFKLALELAEHYGIELTDYTESQVLLKVRNWICTVNVNILKKIVFGYFIEL